MAKTPTPPSVVLVHPQLGENIGMCARAMLNCGLTDLRLVAPRDGWPSEKADAASTGAFEKGVTVSVFDTTHAALEGFHHVLATTARPRDMVKRILTPAGAAELAVASQAKSERTAILFGAERSGLTNEDVALSSAVVTIPLNPDFTSLNIAQAVLVLAYAWRARIDETPDVQQDNGDSQPATHAEISALVARLEGEMDKGGFFRSAELRPTLVRNLVSLFMRTNMTQQEAQTFHGIISALIRQNG